MYDSFDGSTTTGRSGNGDFFVGILAGAALGAAVALLYAPVRGREAREMLSERFQSGLDRANAAMERGRELASHGREVAERGKGMVSDAREVVSQAINDGRDAYRRVKQNA
jgi:gas vesicle protein